MGAVVGAPAAGRVAQDQEQRRCHQGEQQISNELACIHDAITLAQRIRVRRRRNPRPEKMPVRSVNVLTSGRLGRGRFELAPPRSSP